MSYTPSGIVLRIKRRWREPQGYRDVLSIGLPLIASMASATVMQFTDRLFLGRYSVSSIAAALPAGMTAFTFQVALMGLCGYVSVFVAQYVGAGKPKEVGRVFWQGIWLALACGLLLLLPVMLADGIFDWAGHEPEVRAEEVTYFRILMAGSVFLLLNSVVSGFFVGRGHTRPVFIANALGAVVNIPLDYALIFGAFGMPRMGIAGAALATVFGSVFCAVILGVLAFKKRNQKLFLVRSSWRFNRPEMARLLRFGIPSGVNLFMEVVGFTWFTLEIGKLSAVAQAASAIAFSINSLVFLPMLGLNSAIATLVGQAMGRGQPLEAEKATQSALHLSFAYMVPLALCFVLFPGQLLDLFRPAEESAIYPAVKATGIVLLYYVAVYSLVDSMSIVYLGALKGAGDTLYIMFLLVSAVTLCLILPLSILKWTGLAGIHSMWIVLTAYVVALAFLALWRFKRRRWHKIRVIG